MGTKNSKQHYEIVQSKPKSNEDSDRCHVLPNSHGSNDDGQWSGSFYFIQAADTQFGMIDSYLKKLEHPKWDEEMRLTELLISKCNKMEPKPEFMVICGDLIDAMPGTELRQPQITDFKRLFSKLTPDIPLVCVCGNHDIGNEPTMDSLLAYKREFGDDYFYFVKRGVLFIVLNSQFYKHRANLEDYAREQDVWLEKILARCKEFKYSIVFEHIPWFLHKPDEEDDYFNVDRETRLQWLNKFHKAGVNKIMCGHYHRNAGGWYDDMELVVTSAVGAQCGDDKSGVRLVHMLDDNIKHRYYNLEDIPEQLEQI